MSSSSSSSGCPNISTIKSAGGDFSTLQTWEDWADDQDSACQWAECYSGFDMGEVTISGWSSTPTASEYPRIYAADGEKHNGVQTSTSGAYIRHDSAAANAIEISENYTRIEGIKITKTVTDVVTIINTTETSGVLVADCLLIYTGGADSGMSAIYIRGNGNTSGTAATVRNNIIYGGNAEAGNNILRGIRCRADVGGTGDLYVNIWNNSVTCAKSGFSLTQNSGTLYATIENNLAINAETSCFDWLAGNFTSNNNASEDATASGGGGSNHKNSITPANEVTYELINLKPLATSTNVKDSGKTIASFSVDAFGVTRPYGSAWDIGAFEYEPPDETISTIKPAGGGDFSTLQTWEDWADDQVNANQWAECYSGGDLGEVVFSSWTDIPTATVYPRVYVADGEGHNGSATLVGAYIAQDGASIAIDLVDVDYVQIDGLFINKTSTDASNMVDIDGSSTVTGILIENCVFAYNNAGNTNAFAIDIETSAGNTSDSPLVMRNNLIYGAVGGGLLKAGIDVKIGPEAYVGVYNNTICSTDADGIKCDDDQTTMTLSNNICMDNGAKDFNFNKGTITATYNMSEDATAADEGGAGNLISKTFADQFYDTSNNFHLKGGSDALDAGTTIAAFSTDAIGRTRPYPDGGVWDIGALEAQPNISTIKSSGGDFTTLQAWENWADDQPHPWQYAECYSGFDMGTTNISTWSTTPSATQYPKVYTPLTERHTGQSGTGAYLSGFLWVYVPYTRIEGLRIEGQNTSYILSLNATNTVADSNLVFLTNGSIAYSCIRADGLNYTITDAIVQNNICVSQRGTDSTIGMYLYCGNSRTCSYDVYNNTIIGHGSFGLRFYEYASSTLNATAINNISMDSSVDFVATQLGLGTISGSYNLSSDLTGGAYGATGSITGKSSANQFVNPASNWNLLYKADAHDAGDTIVSFDWDADHIEGDNWRPQDDAWDIGALERGEESSSSSSSTSLSSSSSSTSLSSSSSSTSLSSSSSSTSQSSSSSSTSLSSSSSSTSQSSSSSSTSLSSSSSSTSESSSSSSTSQSSSSSSTSLSSSSSSTSLSSSSSSTSLSSSSSSTSLSSSSTSSSSSSSVDSAVVNIYCSNVAADTTTSTAIENIDGLSTTVRIVGTSHIMAFMSFSAYTSASNKSIYHAININGVDSPVYEEVHLSRNDYLSCGVVFRTAAPLEAGTYTVTGRWYTSAGTTATGINFSLVAIPMETNHGDTIPSVYDVVANDTTNATTFEDVDNLSATLTTQTGNPVFAFVGSAVNASSANKDITMTPYVDGFVDQRTKTISSKNQYSSLHVATRTGGLSAGGGNRTVKAQWYTDAGTTATGAPISINAFATETSGVEAYIPSSKAAATNISATSAVPVDMTGVSTTITLTRTANIFVALSLQARGDINTDGFYIINIDGTDYPAAVRTLGGTSAYANIISYASTGCGGLGPLSPGTYTIKGRWYSDDGSTIYGDRVTLSVLAGNTDEDVSTSSSSESEGNTSSSTSSSSSTSQSSSSSSSSSSLGTSSSSSSTSLSSSSSTSSSSSSMSSGGLLDCYYFYGFGANASSSSSSSSTSSSSSSSSEEGDLIEFENGDIMVWEDGNNAVWD